MDDNVIRINIPEGRLEELGVLPNSEHLIAFAADVIRIALPKYNAEVVVDNNGNEKVVLTLKKV